MLDQKTLSFVRLVQKCLKPRFRFTNILRSLTYLFKNVRPKIADLCAFCTKRFCTKRTKTVDFWSHENHGGGGFNYLSINSPIYLLIQTVHVFHKKDMPEKLGGFLASLSGYRP